MKTATRTRTTTKRELVGKQIYVDRDKDCFEATILDIEDLYNYRIKFKGGQSIVAAYDAEKWLADKFPNQTMREKLYFLSKFREFFPGKKVTDPCHGFSFVFCWLPEFVATTSREYRLGQLTASDKQLIDAFEGGFPFDLPDICSMTIPEMKRELESYGIVVEGGRKPDLIRNLQEARDGGRRNPITVEEEETSTDADEITRPANPATTEGVAVDPPTETVPAAAAAGVRATPARTQPPAPEAAAAAPPAAPGVVEEAHADPAAVATQAAAEGTAPDTAVPPNVMHPTPAVASPSAAAGTEAANDAKASENGEPPRCKGICVGGNRCRNSATCADGCCKIHTKRAADPNPNHGENIGWAERAREILVAILTVPLTAISFVLRLLRYSVLLLSILYALHSVICSGLVISNLKQLECRPSFVHFLIDVVVAVVQAVAVYCIALGLKWFCL